MQNWTLSAGTYRYIAMDVYLEEKSQSIDKNNTVLFYAVRAWDTSGNDDYWYSRNRNVANLTIDSKTVFKRTGDEQVLLSIGTDTSANNKRIVAQGELTVAHNTDGTKAVVVDFNLYPKWDQAIYNWKLNQTIDLTDIPRASTFTASLNTANFGDDVKFIINRATENFKHKLNYRIGNKSGIIASDVDTSATWTISNELMSEVPNATKGTITITCDTYSGAELIGSKTLSIIANVPSTIIPSISTVDIAEASYIPSEITSFVQNKSQLNIKTTAQSQYNATIKDISVRVDNKDYHGNDFITDTIRNSGNIEINVVVTDSRGRTTSKQYKISVTEYASPVIKSAKAYRCKSDSDSTRDDQGEYICIKPLGTVSSLNNQNTKSCYIYYKTTSAQSYSMVQLPMEDYILDTELIIYPADKNESYNIYIVLRDSFSDTTYILPDVSAGGTAIGIKRNDKGNIIAIGIGGRPTADANKVFNVEWDVELNGNTNIKGILVSQRVLDGLNIISRFGQRKTDYVSRFFKVAETTIASTNAEATLILFVTGTVIHNPGSGILQVFIRRGNDATLSVVNAKWLIRDSALPKDCVYIVTNQTKAELYCKTTRRYAMLSFQVIYNGDIYGNLTPWTLEKSVSVSDTGLTKLPIGTKTEVSNSRIDEIEERLDALEV